MFKKGLKIIWEYIAQYRKNLIILGVLGIISAIANGTVPYLIGRLFDAILSPSKIFAGTNIEMPLFVFFLLLWLLIKLTADIVDWRNKLKSEYLGDRVYAEFIIKGFSTLLELPISFHKDHKMGDIIDKINRGAVGISMITNRVIIDLAPQFLSIIVAFSISFYTNYIMASFLATGLFVYVMILFKIVHPIAKLQQKMHKAYNTAFGNAYDAVFNIQPVKQAVAEKYEQKQLFKNFYSKAYCLLKKLVAIWQGINFYQRLIITFTQIGIFGFSIFFIHKGQMTIGNLVMFNGYAMMVFGPFVQLGHYWQTVQNGLVALERSEKILSFSKENYIPKNAFILTGIKGNIVFKNVNFTYRKNQKTTLANVNFQITAGQKVAIVGESGVGKTTLVDLISGYYFPNKGKILIDGHNIKTLDLKFLRSKISVVPQEVILFNDTVKNNIRYGNFGASEENIEKAAKMAYAHEFIEKFPKKYNQTVGERGIKLSAGQKQRVAIARAILRDPRILILDEPTSALDAQSEKFIQESLEKLMKGRTAIIIAHRLSTVRKADKILVLEKGKIAEQGKHENLIKIPNGLYRQLYELQIGLK